MLIIQSDEPAEYAAEEIAKIELLCGEHKPQKFSILLTPKRPKQSSLPAMAIPAVEQKGAPVGGRRRSVANLGELVRGIEQISNKKTS